MKELIGKSISNYTIIEYINCGKSAKVFKGIDKNNNTVAIKIFNNDLIEKYGSKIQLNRINKEISLKGHKIENLIQIIDGGIYDINGVEFHYIIMEFIEGKNLKDYIKSESYAVNFIKKVLKILFEVSEFLLEKGIVHRDIKPENIMIDNNLNIIIMDLGVIKFINMESNDTDSDVLQFIGTLRYAPPEFLMRIEENSIEACRAINLYQIGGVLHDLIMKIELFYEYSNPFANLVEAVNHIFPKIGNKNIPNSIVRLTEDLLIKDWKSRLKLCDNNRIHKIYEMEKEIGNEIDEIYQNIDYQRIKEKNNIITNLTEEINLKKTINNCLQQIIEDSIQLMDKHFTVEKLDIIKFPIWKNKIPMLGNDALDYVKNTEEGFLDNSMIFKINGDEELGFISPFYLLVRFQNNIKNVCNIQVIGFFFKNFKNINEMLFEVFKKIIGVSEINASQKIEGSISDNIKEDIIKSFREIIIKALTYGQKIVLEKKEKIEETLSNSHNKNISISIFKDISLPFNNIKHFM